ncbi:MAG: FecR domain-containing protein [Kofleriaceae bacterium]
MTGPERDRLPRETLAAFEVPPMSRDLTVGFVALLQAEPGHVAPHPRRRWLVAVAATLAVAAGVVIGVWWQRGRSDGSPLGGPATGDIAATERIEIRLPRGSIAVAESGSRVRWHIDDDGATRVDQIAGDVFYRIEPGHGFIVDAPGSTVTSTGTCFRVDLPSNETITVYEGAVIVAVGSERQRVVAGGRVTAGSGRGSPVGVTARATAAPSVAALQARVADLEAEVAQLRDGSKKPPNRYFELSPQELTELAHRCSVPFDVPPTTGSTMDEQLLEIGLTETKFSPEERATVIRVIEALQPAYEAELRALYSETTGESGDSLDLLTLMIEIVQKTPDDQIAAAQMKVSRERAGMTSPPADPSKAPVPERFFRLGITAGDRFERALARELPPARVRELRGYWGILNFGSSCPNAR